MKLTNKQMWGARISFTLLFGILFFMFIMPYINSQEQSIGTVKINQCIVLPQSASNSTYSNITSIQYPDKTKDFTQIVMTKQGTEYNYTFCNTTQLGSYIVNGKTDVDGIDIVWGYTFEVTPSGQNNISSGQGLTLLGSLLVIVLGGIAFFILFFKAESLGFKTVWGSLAVVDMIIAILFSMVLITQVVGGYDSLVSGFTTFWFVVQILIFIGFSAFILFAFYLSFMLWKFKRGHIS